ncbi:ABC transporter related [Beutenbergia cavernae DSM 12333]|uniref:ABC transporter related n=1 Tax=Beutenbergia cavernae (strain ATCC BAA-8 / DSM 12333 / CCUG 43141 / JCM 11478 / NBRC 16432 / NCIMB 13614 / HKI 0122) TaxID=471853 RepID=C5C0L9_BEUC1|nr:ABC transporter ATP-binding protein [Beutenbergia cavernae]ACQ81415.1 ABC transporter related [Beutenbergia cavernae DSM 12333]
MTEQAIRVRRLTKRYGGRHAVAGIDLDVDDGEIVAVLGPNGAGKTTTVEILEGYRRRDSGDVRVLGEDPGRAGRRWRAGIGVVLQSTHDMAEMTVREQVRQFARYYPDPRDPDEVIAAVGLAADAGTRSRHLSGGRRRRLDVALGIVGRPRLLFLDEPTTGFDPEARRAFWALIGELRAAGTTILLTTHYLEEAEALADRAVVVARGRVVATGAPARLGDRAARRATVRWTEGGRRHEVLTDTPTREVSRLADRLGAEIPGLEVVRPTLEDVYLALVGPPASIDSGADAREAAS